MATGESTMSSTSDIVTNADSAILLTSPLYLHPYENLAQLFWSDLLTDLNYGEWINDMTKTLISKNKMAFVDSSLARSAAGTGVRADAWDRCDGQRLAQDWYEQRGAQQHAWG
ncbi:unnamed protein product [Linum trigynum]|uniref:NADPH-dependent FMN reductase-like domain-containing protein n=1 Tax=Linum trigynum TaxID=586398 RepID=A0AAV2E678_9ROSI